MKKVVFLSLLTLVMLLVINNSQAQNSPIKAKNFTDMKGKEMLKVNVNDSVKKTETEEKDSINEKLPVIFDSTETRKFSLFLLNREKEKVYSYNITNSSQDKFLYWKKNGIKIENEKRYIEFILFFIILPVLIYCFRYIKRPFFNIYENGNEKKENFEYYLVILLSFPLFSFIFSNWILEFCISNKVLPSVQEMYFLNNYKVLIVFIVSFLFNYSLILIVGKNSIFLSVFISLIASLFFGVYIREIELLTLGIIFLILLFSSTILKGFIEGFVSGFKKGNKKLKEKIDKEIKDTKKELKYKGRHDTA